MNRKCGLISAGKVHTFWEGYKNLAQYFLSNVILIGRLRPICVAFSENLNFISKLVSSSKQMCEITVPQLFKPKVKNWGTVILPIFTRMRPNWKYLLRLSQFLSKAHVCSAARSGLKWFNVRWPHRDLRLVREAAASRRFAFSLFRQAFSADYDGSVSGQ